jgi:membrane-associated phospholipid phosphatase
MKPQSGTKKMAGFKLRFLPADWLIYFYLGLVSVIILIRYNKLSFWGLYIFFHLLLVIISIAIVSDNSRRISRKYTTLHVWYPVIFFIFLYVEANLLNQIFFSSSLDPVVAQVDQRIFPMNLHLFLYQNLHSLLVDELFHGIYFSYYIIMFLPGILMLKKKAELSRELAFVLTFTMLVSYILFIIFPVYGPVEVWKNTFKDGIIFIPVMKIIYRYAEVGGGAIPSTHVAGSIVVAFYSLKYSKKMGVITWTLAFLIGVSTIYGGFHYSIDLLAGVLMAIWGIWFGKKVYPYFKLQSISEIKWLQKYLLQFSSFLR